MSNVLEPMSDEWLAIGKVVAPHGLKGDIRVYPDSDFPERFEVPGDRWLSYPDAPDHLQRVQLTQGYYLANKNLYVIRLEGIHERNSAEALRGCTLWVKAADRPHLAEGEFYLLDLVGLEVRLLATGETIGQVVSIVPAGNDLLEVQLTANPKQVALIPFVEEIVPHIDLERGYLDISPPMGLLPPS